MENTGVPAPGYPTTHEAVFTSSISPPKAHQNPGRTMSRQPISNPPSYDYTAPSYPLTHDYTAPSDLPTHSCTAPSYPPYNAIYPQGENVVVTTQPMMFVAPMQSHEPDYLGYSILTMLCCCWCLGIVALLSSMKVRDANIRGEAILARASSRQALRMNHVSLGLGIALHCIWIGYVIYVIVLAAKLSSSYSYSYGQG